MKHLIVLKCRKKLSQVSQVSQMSQVSQPSQPSPLTPLSSSFFANWKILFNFALKIKKKIKITQ